MSAEVSQFYHPQAFVGNYLLPRLKDPQFLQVDGLPSDQALIVSNLLSGVEFTLEKYLSDLEYLLSSALAPEAKIMLSDFVHLTILIKLLQNIKENYSSIFTELNNISDTKFNKDFIYDLVWPELCRSIQSESTTEALIKYLPLVKQIDGMKRESCYDVLFLQVSQIVDISKNDARYLAQQLVNLYDLREVQALEVIVETLLQQLMSIVSQFETVKGLREEYRAGFEACPEEDIKAAFGLLKGVEVSGVLKERFDCYRQIYQSESQIINNDEEQIDKKNTETEKEAIINYESDSFNTSGLESTLIEANKVIQNLPIKNFAQIKILEKVWAINIPEKHLEVFKALIKDENNNDILVALKCNYTRSIEKSLTDQAEYMALMQQNRNFLKLFGSFWDIDDKSRKNRYNLIMEYAPETLSSRIERWEREQTPKSVREAEALVAAKELIQGMRDLNEKSISHRDLKPDNIFITQDNVYKIADFDVSKKHEKNQFGITVTSVNAGFAGTQVFLSPELWDLQHNGKNFGRINYNKSDVYSLGLTILRMVTNRNCNSWNCFSDFLESNMQRIIEEEVVDVKLKGIIKMMLIVDPETRPKFRLLAQGFNEVEATFICD